MPRTRLIPDTQVFATLRRLVATEGEAAASFRVLGRATGLAAATLVQRYGSAEAMVRAAALDGWDLADAALEKADAEAAMNAKGATALLKLIGATPPMSRDPQVMARAAKWRKTVIKALAARLGNVQAAAMMFAAWQGRLMWDEAGGHAFSLRDLVKRLT